MFRQHALSRAVPAAVLAAVLSCVPPKPPPQQLRKAPGPYAAIDAHALSAPAAAAGSVHKLARYLVRPARNERERARAIFRWICANVDYNVAGYETGHFGAEDPLSVMRTHEAVCEGFSNLFQALAEAAGLQAVTIHGYAKGLGYEAGDDFHGPTNHAWNAVRIDGAWRLVDCTWGAGAVNDQGKYERRFEPWYFLTPPEQFLYTHWPKESRWQLVKHPISLARFQRLPYLKPAFFKEGLQLLNHRTDVIRAEGPLIEIGLEGPGETLILARLMQRGEKKPGSLVQVERQDKKIGIKVLTPHPGVYLLRIYATHKGGPTRGKMRIYDWALDYRIVVRRGAPGKTVEEYLRKKGRRVKRPAQN